MRRRLGLQSDEMAVALAVWLCSLPALGMIILPLFGPRVGLLTALLVLIALMIVCWGMCGRRLLRP